MKPTPGAEKLQGQEPPRRHQPHTFTSDRGDQLVRGVTMRDLYEIVRDRVEYACRAVEQGKSYDPDAVAQNFCCEVEKKMGIYPNVPDLISGRTPPLQSFDAVDWAKEFCRLHTERGQAWIDESLMISWFANALMRGFDEAEARARKQAEAKPAEPDEAAVERVAQRLRLAFLGANPDARAWDQLERTKGRLAKGRPRRPSTGGRTMSQHWTFEGTRGDQIISGITMRDLYKIVRDRVEYACRAVEQGKSYDPDAVAQNFCCEVEKKMGIFPNIPPAQKV